MKQRMNRVKAWIVFLSILILLTVACGGGGGGGDTNADPSPAGTSPTPVPTPQPTPESEWSCLDDPIIQLPQTGQTYCYDPWGGSATVSCEDTGQDGEFKAGLAWPDPRFTSGAGTESECMVDNLTGLMWPKYANVGGGTMAWQDALEFANEFSLCGHTDWRLPNINELQSLSNSAVPNAALWLTSLGFSNVPGYCWSSTTVAGQVDHAWVFGIWDGWLQRASKTNHWEHTVWPVRGISSGPAQLWSTGQTTSYDSSDDGAMQEGASWPVPRFDDLGDGTVVDDLTGLMWTQDASSPGPAACNPGRLRGWHGAFSYVNCLNSSNYLGHADWRLPNRRELLSLIDRSVSNPAIPKGHPFINVAGGYLSSSTAATIPTYAWIVYSYGMIGSGSKENAYNVWPVRFATCEP